MIVVRDCKFQDYDYRAALQFYTRGGATEDTENTEDCTEKKEGDLYFCTLRGFSYKLPNYESSAIVIAHCSALKRKGPGPRQRHVPQWWGRACL